MLRLNKKYLSLLFVPLVFIFSGCGEDLFETDEDTHATPAPYADTAAPTGTITINSGASPNITNSTLVTLNISATDYTGVSQMCVSDSISCTAWETVTTSTTFTTSKAWTLPTGDATKTVYVWFKDTLGNANATPYSGTINLDTTAPTDGTLTATASPGSITLTWPVFLDTGSGIKNYTLVYNIGGSAPADCAAGTAVANLTADTIFSGGTYTFVHSAGLTSGTTTYYRLCATDWAGNRSAGAITQATP